MRTAIIAVLSLLIATLACAGVDLEPGLWEITTQMEMPGLPVAMPATTSTQCITEKDMVPQGGQAAPSDGQEQCKVVSQSIEGSTVTWETACDTPQGEMTSQGSISYSGDSFEGTSTTSGAAMPQPMTSKMSGKRIGKCR